MNKYQHSKIYKIVSSQTDQCYVGSTIRPLTQRFSEHIHHFKYPQSNHTRSSRHIMKYNDAHVVLIEEYPCNSKLELELREKYYIKSLNCCNQIVPARTDKEYREDNKESKRQRDKEWRENNKERKIQTDKEYREKNKEKIKKRKKQYYEYVQSWGYYDNRCYHTNLTKISPDIFK